MLVQMGYGGRALELLHQYYEFKFPPLDDLPDPADTQVEPVTGTRHVFDLLWWAAR